MDSITELIKTEIKKQYGTLKKFSVVSEIPYSTLTNALTKGVGGTSYNTVIKICKLLNIRQSNDSDLVLFNQEFHDFYVKLTALDEKGRHTVDTVLTMEYDRCVANGAKPTEKDFNNIGLAVRKRGGK